MTDKPLRVSIAASDLDVEASETFVFRQVAEERSSSSPPRLQGFVRKVIHEKRRCFSDIAKSLQHQNGDIDDDWVDQIVGDQDESYPEEEASTEHEEPTQQNFSDDTLRGSGKSIPTMEVVTESFRSSTAERKPLLSTRRGRKANGSRIWKHRMLKVFARMRRFFSRLLLSIRIVWLALPLAGVSWFFFYKLGNPSPDFLPGSLTLSWMGNFFARHIVLLATSRMIQFLLLDCFLLSSRVAIRFSGPPLTLTLSQAKGWPFVATTWSLLALFLLQGNDEFQKHWFYWTGWAVYSSANSGAFILDSKEYHRFLMGMLVTGLATTFKRAYLTVLFGKRQFQVFRPKLRKLLFEVLVVSEMALLSSKSVDEYGHQRSLSQSAKEFQSSGKRKIIGDTLKALRYDSVRFGFDLDTDTDDDDSRSADSGRTSDSHINLSPSQLYDDAHHHLMKHMLERWEEPRRDDGDQDIRGSIEDVLRFQRALTYMDDEYPFGEDFGLAPTRDECVNCSQELFERLCQLHKRGGKDLPFSCFNPLLRDSHGTVDQNKRALVRGLFLPNGDDHLDLFSFVQSVDSVYRRLRYFGASVRNDAALDKVLEGIVNGFYYFALVLFLVSLLNFNPWSMLVSITSLLVSLSFAFGQTVARYVEGILTVATSRPFDLGDRIYLGSLNESNLHDDISGVSWLVEEVNLTRTKLRYATTGEVMYLSNHLISSFRVYNLNRTSNASVTLHIKVGMGILKTGMLKKLKERLHKYVSDNPRRWDGIQDVRLDDIDAAEESATLLISVRHRCSWQDAPRIKKEKGSLLRALYHATQDLGVDSSVPPHRSILYHGGILNQGSGTQHRSDLLAVENVTSGKSL